MINYIDLINCYLAVIPQAEQLKYISGKWFVKNAEIKEPISYLMHSSLFTDINNRCRFFGNIRSYKELQEWLDNYYFLASSNVDKFGKWPKTIYQNKEYILSLFKNDSNRLYDIFYSLKYKPNEKELALIYNILFNSDDEKIYIIYGCGGSGKSTFLNLIKQFFDNDVSATSLDSLSNDFILAEAVKHRLIMSDELNSNDLNNANLKTLASHQCLNLNPKNKTPYEMKTQSILIFATNKIPKIDIADSGILRRILYYEKNQKIEKPNKKLQNLIFKKEELEAIAFMSILKTFESVDDIFKAETRAILSQNNSVYLCGGIDYQDYKIFCIQKGYKAYNEKNFYDILQVFKEWGLINE